MECVQVWLAGYTLLFLCLVQFLHVGLPMVLLMEEDQTQPYLIRTCIYIKYFILHLASGKFQ
jgi:hypothetical protein